MSDAQRYLTDKLEPIELANGRPAKPARRQAVVILASDYDVLAAELHSASSRLHEVAFACATAEQERDTLRAENKRLRALLAGGEV